MKVPTILGDKMDFLNEKDIERLKDEGFKIINEYPLEIQFFDDESKAYGFCAEFIINELI